MRANHQYFARKWEEIADVGETDYKVHLTKEQQLRKLLEWGEEHFSRGEIDTATKIFERVLFLDKTNARALNNLGVIQCRLGDAASAIDTFQIALDFNPNDENALANVLQAATDSGRFDLVRRSLLDVLKKAQPANPDLATLIDACRGAA
jgi:Flp pilus assembly protein TadD